MKDFIVRGEKHHNAKLDGEKVQEIREKCKTGKTYRALGEEYGVSKTTVGNIANGRIWKHVEERQRGQ